MVNRSTPHEPGSLLFADEFVQPIGSLRASLHALWIEWQVGWTARRVAVRPRKTAANGRPVCRQRANCGTLPKWQNH